jgi:conjugative relaxase-like TrwC/TraI family protein
MGLTGHACRDAALRGVDPKTGRLAQVGGRGRAHSAGWNMTFSAPKSGSVLWAASEGHDRELIEQAHRSAVPAATAHLEGTALETQPSNKAARYQTLRGCLLKIATDKSPPGVTAIPAGFRTVEMRYIACPSSSASTPCSPLTCDSIA